MIASGNKVYTHAPLDFSLSAIPSRREPSKVLMATPDYFDIIDVKNPHMEGQAGNLDKEKAAHQWKSLKSVYEELVVRGILEEVRIVPGAMGCEDMVFAANQTFPMILPAGEKAAVISKMKHPSRQREVPFFEKFFSAQGYKIIHLEETELFEGMGDTIPHPGKRLVYGGYGHRSEPEAYEEISRKLGLKVIALELKDERFYHLDTCFVPLDKEAVMLTSEAFTPDGMKMIQSLFSRVIEIPMEEAAGNFALNAHVIHNERGKVAILQKGNKETVSKLQEAGYEVREVDTSEFMKSGGSVFCMKMMYY